MAWGSSACMPSALALESGRLVEYQAVPFSLPLVHYRSCLHYFTFTQTSQDACI